MSTVHFYHQRRLYLSDYEEFEGFNISNEPDLLTFKCMVVK